jgi:hypothetical protein
MADEGIALHSMQHGRMLDRPARIRCLDGAIAVKSGFKPVKFLREGECVDVPAGIVAIRVAGATGGLAVRYRWEEVEASDAK